MLHSNCAMCTTYHMIYYTHLPSTWGHKASCKDKYGTTGNTEMREQKQDQKSKMVVGCMVCGRNARNVAKQLEKKVAKKEASQ